MKKFKIDNSSTILPGHEVYEFNKFSLQETASSMDGVKNVYFIPSTEFPRADFKKYYPNINIKRKIDDADIVIFDEKTKTPKYTHISESFYSNWGYYINDNTLLLHDRYTPRNRCGKDTTNLKSYNGSLVSAKDHKRYDDIIKSGLPLIHVNTVFKEFTSEVREFDFTEDLAKKCLRQVLSKDIPEVQTSLDIAASLDPKIYLPFQSLIYSAFRASGIPVRDIKSKKFDMFKKFMYGKLFNFQVNYNRESLWFHGRKFLDYSELLNIESFVNHVNKNDNFTEDMNYDTALIYLLSNDFLGLEFKNIDVSINVYSIKSDKIKSKLIKVSPLTTKKNDDEDFNWGL